MMANRMRLIPALVPIFLLMSCGSEQQQAPQQQSYKDTKSIVLDVLKTEDAQKAIEEASKKSKDQTLSLLATGEGQQIQVAVRDLLTSQDQGVKMLEATMRDPKFAGDFAKAAQTSLKQIQKDLLKDPDYQKSMFEALNNTEFQQILLQTMKSTKYRQQMMDVVMDSLKSPLFKAELITMFEKAVDLEMQKQEQTLTITPQGGGGKKEGGGEKKEGGGGGSGGGGGGSEGGGSEGGGGGSEGGGESGGSGGESGGGGGDEESKKK
jgi:spore germination protein D